jgi:hypothetical protein
MKPAFLVSGSLSDDSPGCLSCMHLPAATDLWMPAVGSAGVVAASLCLIAARHATVEPPYHRGRWREAARAEKDDAREGGRTASRRRGATRSSRALGEPSAAQTGGRRRRRPIPAAASDAPGRGKRRSSARFRTGCRFRALTSHSQERCGLPVSAAADLSLRPAGTGGWPFSSPSPSALRGTCCASARAVRPGSADDRRRSVRAPDRAWPAAMSGGFGVGGRCAGPGRLNGDTGHGGVR